MQSDHAARQPDYRIREVCKHIPAATGERLLAGAATKRNHRTNDLEQKMKLAGITVGSPTLCCIMVRQYCRKN